MSRRIKTKGKKTSRVHSTSRSVETVEAQTLAVQLNAQCANDSTGKSGSEAPASFALRREGAARRSTPEKVRSLRDHTRDRTIPISDEDWQRLEQRAQDGESTPEHVASLLLHQALKALDED